MSRKELNCRLYLICFFFILSFSLLLARLVYIQLFKSQKLRDIASGQHRIFTEIQPKRGGIFDRNRKALAINIISYSIFATGEIAINDKLEKRLCSILELDRQSLKNKLNSDKNFVWLKRKVSPDIAERIKNLNIPGIAQIREYRRFYPNGSLACHLIGFTDIDNRGLEGVELFCNSYLAGIKGWRLAQRDAKRREVFCWGYKSIPPTHGYDVILTIDSVIQNIAERHLKKAAQKYRVLSATAIVMQPATGEILALCNYPDYDLNHFQQYKDEVRRNLAITDIFEPGSSFKFVTASACLEEGKVKLEDKFFCEQGRFYVGRRLLRDYKPYGELSFKEVMEHSSNIGIVKAAQLLGEERLYQYIKDFGFGSLTGIELPGEVKGIIRPPDKWSKVSITSIPIGQEIAVTPIQLISAISCIANEGILVSPRILKCIQNSEGQILKSFTPQKLRRVISPQTARALKEVLTGVVEKGTGKRAKVPGYKTAGKTGTAQKPNPEGGYYSHRYFSSFVGFVPADEPIISVLVVFNEPRPQYFGSRVAAPVFRKIAAETLRYLEMSGEISK